MSDKRGFTLDDHKQAGEELNQMFTTISALSERIDGGYTSRGHVGYHCGHQLQKAKTALLLVRQTLIGDMEDKYPFVQNDYYRLSRL